MALVHDHGSVPAPPPGDALFSDEGQLALLRRRLVRFFSSKAAGASADELADDVVLRIVENTRSGTHIENVSMYAFGVARRVWLEHLRNPSRTFEPLLEDRHPAATVAPEAEPSRDLECLDRCLLALRPGDRALILRFYGESDDGLKNKERRKRLAEELQISANALLLRASRLRQALRGCVEQCCDCGAKEAR
jgi:DNA-directed RNA polymerase specialized sigma24 family protein